MILPNNHDFKTHLTTFNLTNKIKYKVMLSFCRFCYMKLWQNGLIEEVGVDAEDARKALLWGLICSGQGALRSFVTGLKAPLYSISSLWTQVWNPGKSSPESPVFRQCLTSYIYISWLPLSPLKRYNSVTFDWFNHFKQLRWRGKLTVYHVSCNS